MKRILKYIQLPSSLLPLAYSCLLFSVVFIIISDDLSEAWSAPPIDADTNWGRGAQLSLTNPAHIPSTYGRVNLSYDLILPQLEQVLRPDHESVNATDWGHELYLGATLGDHYSFTFGHINLPPISLENSTVTDLPTAWSMAQALKLSSRLSLGLTYIRTDQASEWLGGFSYGVTPWLLTSITMSGTPNQAYKKGLLSIGLGLKPFDPLSIGLTTRPSQGGGQIKLNTQLDIWRGLCLEFSWLRDQANLSIDAPNFLLRYHDLLDNRSNEKYNFFNLAISWKGRTGWRMESGLDRKSPARLSFRLESETKPTYQMGTDQLLFIINARDSREVAFRSSLFSRSNGYSPFFNTLKQLQDLQQADQIKVALLLLGGSLGYAQAEEMIEAIQKLRLKGTIVYAYLPQANLANFLVAASCDIIWASPTAELSITGILSERFYFRKALDLLNIIPEILTVGDFKSAPEIFEREEPSKSSQAMDKRLLDARFSRLITLLAYRVQQQRWAKEPSPSLTKGKRLITLRKIKDDEPLNGEDKALAITWINEGPYSAQSALKRGLIDRVVSPTVLEETLKKTHPQLSLRTNLRPIESTEWAPLPKIAVIHAAGEIGSGGGLGNASPNISASTYVPLIKKLTYDPMVKGVVLRIDSPGGTVTDADAIWQALKGLVQRKPLAISMGNIAASGGYYIAAPGQKIFASPSTLTGSIGVFAGKVDLSGLLEDLGINVYRQGRGNIVSKTLFTPWSAQARKTLIKELDHIYELFLSRITDTRPTLTKEVLLPLAGGRVWTGDEAHANGLVDIQGGLIDAIKWVSVEANLAHKAHSVTSVFPSKPSFISRAIGIMGLSLNSSKGSMSLSQQGHAPSSLSMVIQTIFVHLPSALRFALNVMGSSQPVPLALDPRL